MRIACLQFAPQVGDINNNLNRADAVLSKADPKDLDLLVLPELAFTGYNFRSLQHISPFLEPTTAGISSLWARTTALKYNCIVHVGYPEKVDIAPKWPADPEYYNSTVTVSADGETIANYRKSFLYYTDETWALEGPSGFFSGAIEGLGNVAMGICMDLNPYKFEAPWTAWEFAHHVLRVKANIVIMSMAWLTREDVSIFSQTPREPDMDTLAYWLARLEPIIRAEAEGEIIVVFANRCGVEDDVIYAGTSAVLGINAGEVRVYGILGRGEKELLVIDTDRQPQAKLISQQNFAASAKQSAAPAEDVAQEYEKFSEYPSDTSQLEDDGYECISPVSPTDVRFPQEYYGDVGHNPRNFLRSSIGFVKTPSTKSPTSRPPPTPKSRNTSRNGQCEDFEPKLEEAVIDQTVKPSSEIFQVPGRGTHSASAAPESFESSFTRNPLGPRTRHISPRPTSTMW